MSVSNVMTGDFVVSRRAQVIGINDIRVQQGEVLLYTKKTSAGAELTTKDGVVIRNTVLDSRYRLPYNNEKLWGKL